MPKTRASVRRCHRCGGQLYSDDPYDPRSAIWCLMCCAWIPPDGYIPKPFLSRIEDDTSSDAFYVDEHGDILDIIDQRIEEYMMSGVVVTVSSVAKKVHCSNFEARQTLERLTLRKKLTRFTYGPQQRWIGYRKADERLGD